MTLLIILWVLFFTTHSLFASDAVKPWVNSHWPAFQKPYRIAYNVLAFTLLSGVIIQVFRIDAPALWDLAFFGKTMTIAFAFSGLGIIYRSFSLIGWKDFLGLANYESTQELVTNDWYAILRHPLYWGITLLLVGIVFWSPTLPVLISVGFCLAYIVIGIELEEKKLRVLFGEKYVEYARGKKKFLPWVY